MVSMELSPASSRVELRYISLIYSVWAILHTWLLVMEGSLLGRVFITRSVSRQWDPAPST